MTELLPSFPYTWRSLETTWTCFQGVAGRFTTPYNASTGALSLAVAVPDRESGGWRTSFMLAGYHTGHGGFLTHAQARQDAEKTLTASFLQQGLSEGDIAFEAIPEDPYEEIQTILAVLLADDWQLAHISTYRKEWVAVCINNNRTQVRDYAFARDSENSLGWRATQAARRDYVPLAALPTQSAEIKVNRIHRPLDR